MEEPVSRDKEIRRGVRVVVESIVREELADLQIDVLAVRGILLRGFFGRLRWLLTGK
jgi:hypothetical protein